ncbi:acyltransferase family protein [Yersinia enterocolitica]|uniref:acyltransferase family protein n=1 Tax=Yersinia enterocolitica TaxID=630 RepID=UPI001C60FCD3|nr:acyltransferase [Yersinia enterocolitica]MBW5846027.1 acyltransferase [Yersinia enterocolitica]MBW5863098.1 acyltransferase [Yersinia enterocolitica]
MTDTSSGQISKIYELESLRGIASLFIVIYHIPSWNPFFHDYNFMKNGYLMVELFFVLSGYVIYSAYSDRLNSPKQLLRFQFLRFARLYPVHLLFLAAFVFIELAKYYAQHKLGISSPNSQPFRENSITALIQNIFLVQAIGPTGNAVSFNGPSWSISVEFYTYLVFGLIVLFAGRFKNIIFLSLVMLSLVLIVADSTFGFYNLIGCFTGFFTGCLTAYLKNKFNRMISPVYLALSALAAFLFLTYKTEVEFDPFFYLLASALIFTLVSSKSNIINEFLKSKILVWLGTISYSMYMSHFAIIWVVSQLVRFGLKRPEVVSNGLSAPQLTIAETGVAYLIIIASVLLISTLVYKYLENPLRLKSRKVKF